MRISLDTPFASHPKRDNSILMTRAAVIVENAESQIALIRRQRGALQYYLLPGGKVEPGEDPQSAAIREAYEELGLNVAVDRLVAEVRYGASVQYYFRAVLKGGVLGTGKAEELGGLPTEKRGTYLPMWMPYTDLTSIDGRPRELFRLLAKIPARGWPIEPISIVEPRPD